MGKEALPWNWYKELARALDLKKRKQGSPLEARGGIETDGGEVDEESADEAGEDAAKVSISGIKDEEDTSCFDFSRGTHKNLWKEPSKQELDENYEPICLRSGI